MTDNLNEVTLPEIQLNLYSKLFFQMEEALFNSKNEVEESREALSLALKSWDKEQAYESFLINKLNTGQEIDVVGFNKIIKRKHIKEFNRVLAKLGLNKELAESIKLSYTEKENENVPLPEGPFAKFLLKLSQIQQYLPGPEELSPLKLVITLYTRITPHFFFYYKKAIVSSAAVLILP